MPFFFKPSKATESLNNSGFTPTPQSPVEQHIAGSYIFIVFILLSPFYADYGCKANTGIMLQLPSAWTNIISESTHGASCLGQLSGLEAKKEIYKKAVATLCDGALTTLMLVTRPDIAPLKEAARASEELSDIGVNNQILIVNGVLTNADDEVSKKLQAKQDAAMSTIADRLKNVATFSIPLRAYNILGLENIRSFLKEERFIVNYEELTNNKLLGLNAVINDLYTSGKRVIFTMGKGGVGKTTIAFCGHCSIRL